MQTQEENGGTAFLATNNFVNELFCNKILSFNMVGLHFTKRVYD